MNCVLKAIAEVTGLRATFLIEKLGHDGTAILFPELPEPYNQRSFHIDEFKRVLYDTHSFEEFDAHPVLRTLEMEYDAADHSEFITELILKSSGIILGRTIGTGIPHAEANFNGRFKPLEIRRYIKISKR